MRRLEHCNIVKLKYFFYSSGDKVSKIVHKVQITNLCSYVLFHSRLFILILYIIFFLLFSQMYGVTSTSRKDQGNVGYFSFCLILIFFCKILVVSISTAILANFIISGSRSNFCVPSPLVLVLSYNTARKQCSQSCLICYLQNLFRIPLYSLSLFPSL